MKWICSYTEYQPNSETLMSWALIDRLEKGPLTVTFSVIEISILNCSSNMYRFLCLLNIQIEWQHSVQVAKIVCQGPHLLQFFCPCYVTYYRNFGLESPSRLIWIRMSPFFFIKLIILVLSWFKQKATNPSQSLGQMNLHFPYDVDSCKRS